HFGTVDELLSAACRHATEQRIARYGPRLAGIGSLSELLAFGRAMHEEERAAGHVAVLGQLLAGAQTQDTLAAATAAGLDLWIAEIERVLARVLPATPFGEFTDVRGLSRAVAASFVGIELYEGVDPAGAGAALDALEQLGALVAALEDLGPVAQRAVRHHLRGAGRRCSVGRATRAADEPPGRPGRSPAPRPGSRTRPRPDHGWPGPPRP